MISWLKRKNAEMVARQVISMMDSGAFRSALTNGNILINAQTFSDTRSFADKGYASNVYVYSVISQKATLGASIPWYAYRVKDARKVKAMMTKTVNSKEYNLLKQEAYERVTDHPIQDILDCPNPLQGASEYNSAIFAMKDIAGETFEIHFAPDEYSDKWVRWYQVQPWNMEVEVGQDFLNPIGGYKVLNFGDRGKGFPVGQVLHQKYFNPMDFWRGLSPLQAAIMNVTESNAQQEWGASLAQNHGHVNKVLSIEDMAGSKAPEVKEAIHKQRLDKDMAGLPVVLGNMKGINVIDLAVNMADAKSLERIQLTANQIALAFKWPAELIGDAGQKTHANYEQAIKWAWQSSLLPMLDDRRDELNRFHRKGILEGGKYYIDYDVSDVEALQPEVKELSDRVSNEWRSDLITLEEAREKLNYDTTNLGVMGGMRYSDMRMASFAMQDIERDMKLMDLALKDK